MPNQMCRNGHDTHICGRNKRGKCKTCVKESDARLYAKVASDPERLAARREATRERHLKRVYGLTTQEEAAKFESQGSKCALFVICGRTKDNYKSRWSVDHDHTTGKVRGILCHGCNTGLGRLGDNAAGVRIVLQYLVDSGDTS